MLKKILHNISVIINLFFALLLLLSNISVLIDPSKLWLFSFLSLAFPYLMLVNIAFVIYWLVKKRWLFLISLIIMVLGWNNISAYIQIPFEPFSFLKTQPTKNAVKVKVLTYNVRSFNRYMWINKTNTTEEILKFIRKEKPDIICFQEFYSNPKNGFSIMNIISKLKPNRYNCAFFSYSNQTETNLGIAVFSKYPIIKKKQISFKETLNTSMYCDLVIKKDTVRLFNNHLQSFKLLKGDLDFFDTIRFTYNEKNKTTIKNISYKLREAYKLRSMQVKLVSEQINKSPYPVIVCGDFNDTPVSFTYRKMRGNLSDVFNEKGKGIGNTYNGNIPSFRIDYILHSRHYIAIDYKCVRLDYSDHYPVISKLSLQKK